MMSKVTLFKEVKTGLKKSRENSYYNGKKRIYYQCVTVELDKTAPHLKKGFHEGLPTGEAPAKQAEATETQVEANADSQTSNTQASA